MAHPFVIDDPVCAQCRWEYENTDYGKVDFIEVWGHAFHERLFEMRKTLDFWNAQLNRGHWISGTASIELHDPDRLSGEEDYPCNVAHVSENGERALIEALRRGDFYNGASLDLEISMGDRKAVPGGCLSVSDEPREAELHLHIGDDSSCQQNVTMRTVSSRGAFETGMIPLNRSYSLTLPHGILKSGWLRFEFFKDRECSRPLILSNPVCINRRRD